MALTASQKENLKGIITAAKKNYLNDHPIRRSVIATATALTESGLNNYASANVPESLKYPHDPVIWEPDGLGHDHASIGLFQQQTGKAWALPGTTTMDSSDGWGTPKELMNPVVATHKFLKALDEVSGWFDVKPWVAAQDVQHSAFDGNPRSANHYSSVYGGNYKKNTRRARLHVLRYYASVKV